MTNLRRKSLFIFLIAIVLVLTVTFTVFILWKSNGSNQSNSQSVSTPSSTKDSSIKSTPPVAYVGQITDIGDQFKVKVPNGWRASVSTNSSFIAIQFARPSQLESLMYDQSKPPTVDYDGIPAWNGLTEHLYIRALTSASQEFDPGRHAEVTSEPFTFDDGTVGKKFLVTKHAAEAKAWGGLLKDTEWYGRVFVYKKNGKTVEAHLAFYPSTKIDESFYEKVARSITE